MTIRENPTLTYLQIHRLLASSKVFSSLGAADVDALIESSCVVRAERGDVLFRSGDAGDEVMFLLDGRVMVETGRSDGAAVAVNVLGPGELFGEMAVLNGDTRSATVTVLQPSELLVIDQTEFLPILVSHPALGIRILGTVSDRLRRLTDVLGSLQPIGTA